MKLQIYALLTGVTLLSSNLFAGEICVPDKCEVSVNNCATGYVFAYGGVGFGHDTDSTLDPGGVFGLVSLVQIKHEVETGYIVGGGAGLYSCLLGGSRFEIEGLYSSNDVDQLNVANAAIGVTNNAATGDLEMMAVFVNVLKEFPIGCFTAYAGGGLGVAETEWSARSTVLGNPFGIEGEDTSFAYQLKIGADYPICNNISLFGEYKLIGVTSTDYGTFITPAGVTRPTSTDGFITHNFVVGARLAF